jgi:hypothetical protein
MTYEAQACDTTVEIDRMLFDAYRAMTPEQKIRRMGDLTNAASLLALAGIRARHPGCSDREARLRLAALRYGPDLVRSAFGWAPDPADL